MHTFSILDFFNLCAGLAIFLYGMQQGEKNLKRLGGTDLRKIIAIITRHRLSAYAAGFSITMITQSSSATTVMLVGLASANLMSLGQSLGMILGSDLATTFTVQLFAFKFYQIAPLLIATGYLISLICRSEKNAGYGKLLFSLGFIFFGMHMMADSVTPLHTDPTFQNMITASFNNSWYGLLAGTLITATIHSSAATLAIVITLAQAFQDSNGHTLSLVQLFPIVLGANLGTCATALISTLRADLEGTRVAWAHLFFKFIGIVIVFPLAGFISYAEPFFHLSTAFQIAALHTVFNLFISILFLPLLHPFEKLILAFVKPGKKTLARFHVSYLTENVLGLPALAFSQSVKEISRMSERVGNMLEKIGEVISVFDRKQIVEINDLDDEVDFLYEKIVAYITHMARQELDSEQTAQAYELLMITADIEHIGDAVSKNIVYLMQKLQTIQSTLSVEGKKEIIEFHSQTILTFKEVMAAFTMNNKTLANTVLCRKSLLKVQFEQLFNNHMERLYLGKKESLQTTSIHKDLLEEIQRINHFSFRIAMAIIKGSQQTSDADKTMHPTEVIPIVEGEIVEELKT